MRFLATSVLSLFLSLLPSVAQDIGNLAGDWGGSVDMGVAKVRIEFAFDYSDGKLTGTMKSPDQSDQSIAVNNISLEGDRLTLSIPAIAGTYEATVQTEPKSLEGTWKQGGLEFPLTLKPEKPQGPPKRPQDPKPPFPYKSSDVEFENKKENIALAGTLTLPKGSGPFPAAILISGSGPQNRDEELLGHRPFAVIADHLTRQGIAVLRYDDRGIGKSKGTFKTATTKDFADDANSAWHFLRQHPGIQPDAIGMIGHSEGGYIAPLAFMENPDIAFQILLAGPGLPLREIAHQQTALILKQVGLSDEAIESAIALNRDFDTYYDGPEDAPFPADEVSQRTKEWWESLSPEDKAIAKPFQQLQEANMAQAATPWIRFLMKYDPVPALEGLTCPVLALNGEKDTQVLPKPNLKIIEESLTQTGNQHFEIHELPNLNHLFQNCESGAPAEYAAIEETFDPATLKLMSQWILALKTK